MGAEIRIAGIVKESIVDGPGIRYVVFAQGCKHKCPECHNPETHSFSGGELVKVDAVVDSIMKNPLLDGITISGGEPFEQAEGFAELAQAAKKKGLSVMTYTGYTYEHLVEKSKERSGWNNLLENSDVLVDGRFEAGRKNLLLKFKGSENQRLIDLHKSRNSGRTVLGE
ncbi:MAG TPA: anaerobic ribonucleoside-triphosphate reductase activating protein [Clostridia bacterium]|nr:anaerobic ribonucleoside-triphosphate reductase activating protein [Clostridia bacterium]